MAAESQEPVARPRAPGRGKPACAIATGALAALGLASCLPAFEGPMPAYLSRRGAVEVLDAGRAGPHRMMLVRHADAEGKLSVFVRVEPGLQGDVLSRKSGEVDRTRHEECEGVVRFAPRGAGGPLVEERSPVYRYFRTRRDASDVEAGLLRTDIPVCAHSPDAVGDKAPAVKRVDFDDIGKCSRHADWFRSRTGRGDLASAAHLRWTSYTVEITIGKLGTTVFRYPLEGALSYCRLWGRPSKDEGGKKERKSQ